MRLSSPPTRSFIHLHTLALCRDSFYTSACFVFFFVLFSFASYFSFNVIFVSFHLFLLFAPTLQRRISLETCKRLITAEISHALLNQKWVEWLEWADWRWHCRQLSAAYASPMASCFWPQLNYAKSMPCCRALNAASKVAASINETKKHYMAALKLNISQEKRKNAER